VSPLKIKISSKYMTEKPTNPAGPRMTAYDVHDWIFEVLRLPEVEVRIIQIDGTKRQVFIKLSDKQSVVNLLHATAGQVECKYHTGEITQVTISEAGMSFTRIRVAYLPPEEWGVMETETYKLKQDEQNVDSQQQPKRQKKMLKQEKTLTLVTEHTNIVTR
jgi:hypothetical protein